MTHYLEQLKNFKKENEFFVGIDSDGCVFPTMELKHKECFIPNIIKFWELQNISPIVRETAEFVNLYSIYRGINRFPGLVKTVELLKQRKEVEEINFKLPDMTAVEEFVNSGKPLSNTGLKEFLKENPHPALEKLLNWSEAVNKDIAEMVKGVNPFSYVKESLEKLHEKSDIMVVSSTPYEALNKEWNEHNLTKYVTLITGQEMGSKKERLAVASSRNYKGILMVGDAPADHRAALSVGALFYPIKPGNERESWKLFYEEAIDKFFDGIFAGEYQEKLLKEFYDLLPESPPWID